MTPTLAALLGYILWMLSLLFGIATLRSFYTFSGRKAANSYDPCGDDVSALSGRLCRTHANCYESFPVIGGLMLAALASGQSQITDALALYALGARVAQSVVHLLSKSVPAVFIRFGFFLVQVGICLTWLWGFAALV